MIQNSTHKLINTHVLDIGSFYFYDNFMVSEVNADVTFNFEKATKLFHFVREYYGNDIPFVYIANRINSYTFEPTSHFKSSTLFPNLKGYAVVTYNPINSKIARMEQSFLSVPSKVFNSIKDAILWIDELLIEH